MKIAELMDQVRRASGNTLDMLELKRKTDELGIRLENIYQELEMSSSFVDCHRDISSAAETVQPHSHSFFELILCCGCDQVQYLLGSQRYRLQKGDVVLIPPGVTHCPLFPESMARPYERIVLWINPELVTRLCQKWPELIPGRDRQSAHSLLRTAGTVWEEDISDAFYRSCRESERRLPGWEAALYSSTTLLMTTLSRALQISGSQPDSERSELLDELLRFVERHLTEKITVAAAARQLLVSESTITHLCRRRLGVSFYRYVTHQRLTAAKLLMQSGTALSRIPESVGFCDYSAFYRAFKQEFGISPREFRALQNGGL